MSNIADISAKLLEFWGNLTLGNVLTAAGVDRPPTFAPGGGGAVDSVFGRTGAVVAVDDDYRAVQLADEVDGSILTWSAAGEAVLIGPGTLAQVLTSNGAGNAPSFQAAPAGVVKQIVYTEDTVQRSLGAGNFPQDDTIPQNTEGAAEYTQLATTITPGNVANRLHISAQVFGDTDSVSGWFFSTGLFQDSIASAIATTRQGFATQSASSTLLVHDFVAGGTSPITFKIRIGLNLGSFFSNGSATGGRIYGGTLKSWMRITEYTP